jgi:hypothetical protein
LQSSTESLSIHDIESEAEYTARHRREQYAKAMAIKAKIHEAALAMGQLMDDYLLFDDDPIRFDADDIDDATWAADGFQAFPSSSEASASFYRATIGQQPLLEHEFVELFVRVVLEYALRHGYQPNSAPRVPESSMHSSAAVPCWAWMTPYQVLEHILAERVSVPAVCLLPLGDRSPPHRHC